MKKVSVDFAKKGEIYELRETGENVRCISADTTSALFKKDNGELVFILGFEIPGRIYKLQED